MGSRARSRVRTVSLIALAGLWLLAPAGSATAGRGEHRGARDRRGVWPRAVYPAPAAVHRAQRFAAAQGVSFAVIDRSLGLRGYDYRRQFSSASVSKALLLAAELRRLARDRQSLDAGTKALLGPMVTYSDNRAADAIYARVGDQGLDEVAARAGMRRFEPVPGYWGGARVTAADMARFFYRLEANLPNMYRPYAMRLLSRIAPVESWGIPQAVGHGWTVWFKGGWRPPGEKENSGPVTHQAALLEHRRGERVGLAVLSNDAPGGASFAKIEGVAQRLLSSPPPYRGGWTVP